MLEPPPLPSITRLGDAFDAANVPEEGDSVIAAGLGGAR